MKKDFLYFVKAVQENNKMYNSQYNEFESANAILEVYADNDKEIINKSLCLEFLERLIKSNKFTAKLYKSYCKRANIKACISGDGKLATSYYNEINSQAHYDLNIEY